MPIEQIRIRNFRSIRDASCDASSLTVLVGANDEGKSNVLRALDLFFNQTRGSYPFNWERDYSQLAKARKGRAPEIEIQLRLRLPASFNLGGRAVAWTRRWRRSGFAGDTMLLEDGEKLPRLSRAVPYLEQIRFDYVPAIKGPEYFGRLLSNVYDMLDATVQASIRGAAATFTSHIREHTETILAELESQLGLTSDIELPSDLRKLFSDLEFRSKSGEARVALDQRGDGLKVRHIPIILAWLAKQANHLAAKGRPRVETIWGYEEPENNLEMRRCFELASFFVGQASETQVFLTTHSPVFYATVNDEANAGGVRIVQVRNEQSTGSELVHRDPGLPNDVDDLHSSLGFLDLLEPHVLEWKRQVDNLKKRMDGSLVTNRRTVFVEGPTDRTVLLAAIKHLPSALEDVRIECAPTNGGGHGWVSDSLLVWHFRRAEKAAVGLFDNDDGARTSAARFNDLVASLSASHRTARTLFVPRLGAGLELAKKKVKLPVAIEEAMPLELWHEADAIGWLEPRPHLPMLLKFDRTDISLEQWLEEIVPDTSLRKIATHRVRPEYKHHFAKHCADAIAERSSTLDFSALTELLALIQEKLETAA